MGYVVIEFGPAAGRPLVRVGYGSCTSSLFPLLLLLLLLLLLFFLVLVPLFFPFRRVNGSFTFPTVLVLQAVRHLSSHPCCAVIDTEAEFFPLIKI